MLEWDKHSENTKKQLEEFEKWLRGRDVKLDIKITGSGFGE